MDNSVNKYAEPIEVRQTKLSKIFVMSSIFNPEKPWRELIVLWDDRLPLVENFENKQSFFVRFKEAGKIAGGHYHDSKEELDIVLTGEVTIYLEHTKTKEKEKIVINSNENVFLLIPKFVAHTVVATSDNSVLLILANGYETKKEVIPYEMTLVEGPQTIKSNESN